MKIVLWNTLILSNFHFCDVLYGRYIDNVDRSRIQRIQNSCLYFIYGIRRGERVLHKLKWDGWVSMCYLRLMHFACFRFRILKCKAHFYRYKRIRFITDVHKTDLKFINGLLSGNVAYIRYCVRIGLITQF